MWFHMICDPGGCYRIEKILVGRRFRIVLMIQKNRRVVGINRNDRTQAVMRSHLRQHHGRAALVAADFRDYPLGRNARGDQP